MDHHKIIVADNSQVQRMITSKYVEDHFDVLEATTGHEVLDLVNRHARSEGGTEISLVILAVELSDLDGFEIASILRRQYDMVELPIIVSTSHNRRDMIKRAIDSGINDYLVKPFPEELLIYKLKNMLRVADESSRQLTIEVTKIPFFKYVPESLVTLAIETCAETKELAKEDVICTQDDENYDLFILLEGRCDVFFNNRKVSQIHAIDTIGEMGFLAEKPRSATVVASTPVHLLVFAHRAFEEFLNKDRAVSEMICKNVIQTLSNRITKANRLIEQLKNITSEQLTY